MRAEVEGEIRGDDECAGGGTVDVRYRRERSREGDGEVLGGRQRGGAGLGMEEEGCGLARGDDSAGGRIAGSEASTSEAAGKKVEGWSRWQWLNWQGDEGEGSGCGASGKEKDGARTWRRWKKLMAEEADKGRCSAAGVGKACGGSVEDEKRLVAASY